MIVAREQVQQNYGIPSEVKRKKPSSRPERYLSRRHRLLYTGMIALAFVVGVIISFYYAQVFVTNYQIHSLQNQLVALQTETDDLYSDLAKLTSLERIEKVAINELGMVKPDDSDVVRVGIDSQLPENIKPQSVLEQSGSVAQSQKGKTAEQNSLERNWVIQAFSDLVGKVD